MHQFPYSQFEIEKGINDEIKNGDKDDIARLMDVSPTYVCQWLNPDNERKSPVYNFLRFLFAADRLGFGDTVWNFIVRCRSTWRRDGIRKNVCVSSGSKKISDEFGEFIFAQMENKPLNIQIAEIDDVIEAARATKEALIEERDKQLTDNNEARKAFNNSLYDISIKTKTR